MKSVKLSVETGRRINLEYNLTRFRCCKITTTTAIYLQIPGGGGGWGRGEHSIGPGTFFVSESSNKKDVTSGQIGVYSKN